MTYDLKAMPLLPLRGTVVFPKQMTHLDIGRAKSISAVEKAMAEAGFLVIVAQKDAQLDDPNLTDLYTVGTLVKIKQTLRLPGGLIRILVTGMARVSITDISQQEPYLVAQTELLEDKDEDATSLEGYARRCRRQFEKWVKASNVINEDGLKHLFSLPPTGEVADFIASHLPGRTEIIQQLLETTSVIERFQTIDNIIAVENEIAEIEHNLNNQVRKQMEQAQKEYFLREKIRAIHSELGDKGDTEDEANEFRVKLKALELEKTIEERIEREILRYERMPQQMPEATILRNYLEWVLELPWKKESPDRLDIKEAATILDADHYGLEKIKERILEFLAVHHLTNAQGGSILCFVGPPGVGKTSLAASIAKAMNREFVRASLGGMRDEAEIRGHRRTYVGAMPGRMIQGIKNAGTKNPVFLLDEIDKLGADYKGDPSSALLEVLDPEQNKSFSDHFIELPFDFSKVFWITTANDMSAIPKPLLDRMEVIQLSGYTEEEKLEIAKRYLVPKQIKKHGLSGKQVKLSDAVLKHIIEDYTREAGVRTLEKYVAKVCRKVARSIVEDEKALKVSVKNLNDFLGAPIYLEEEKSKKAEVGLVCGLAWTSVGGVVLPCEATVLKGNGKLILTGSLGNVMKESAQAALSYIRKNAKNLRIKEDFYQNQDFHVHLPAGATPKDGPSAGITMTLALVSALTDRKVRADIAMTGEVTIRGQVLPIGGLKEKVLAAHRHGIKEVLIPHSNLKDVEEIPSTVKDHLLITPVRTMDEVLEKALV